MSARFRIAAVASALLLAGAVGPAAEPPAKPQSPKPVSKVYQVADLVIPLDRGGPAEKPAKTLEDRLMKLISIMVAPESWDERGGTGLMNYYPLGMALVVNQTPAVQEQVAELLESLRRLQDVDVAVEFKFVAVPERFYERVGVDFEVKGKTDSAIEKFEPQLTTGVFKPAGFITSFSPQQFQACPTTGGSFTSDLDIPIHTSGGSMAAPPPCGGFSGKTPNGSPEIGVAFLKDNEVCKFLEAIQSDPRTNVLQAPKMTMANGQDATLDATEQKQFVTGVSIAWNGKENVLTPQTETFTTGLRMSLQPVVSADRKFVRLNLQAELSSLDSANPPLSPVAFSTLSRSDNKPITFTQFIQQPKLTKLTADKTLTIPDGGTAVLHCGTRLSEGRNENGPPVLSKVPYVNRLFKNVGYGREAECVLLLVTPRIVVHKEEEEVKQTGISSSGPCPEEKTPPPCAKDEAACPTPCPKPTSAPVAAPPRPCQAYEAATPWARRATQVSNPFATYGIWSCGGQQILIEKAAEPEVAELLKQYDEACAAGRLADATRLAVQALALDPTCFRKGGK